MRVCQRLAGAHGCLVVGSSTVRVGVDLRAHPECGLLCHTQHVMCEARAWPWAHSPSHWPISSLQTSSQALSVVFPVPVVVVVVVAVGAFSISWTSVASSNNRGMLDGKTMVVVLSCVSAAGAILAACCFYFVCCGRRRRAGVSRCNGLRYMCVLCALLLG